MPPMMAAIIWMVSSSSSSTPCPGLNPPQLVQHGGQLVPQGLVHPGIALYHHIPAQAAAG